MAGSKLKKRRMSLGPVRLFLLLLWPIGGAALLWARHSEAFAEEIYAQRVYPLYHRAISLLPEHLPFSLGELLLYAAGIFVPIAILTWVLHIIIKKGRRWPVFVSGILNALCVLGLVFSMFVFGCGMNYYRSSYAEAAGLDVRESTQEELYAMCLDLAQKAADLRDQLTDHEDAAGVFSLPRSYDEAARQAMTDLGTEEEMLNFRYPRPKAVWLSRGMSCFGIVGIYSPFTGEANVNTDTTPYTIPAAICHELCHTAGIMREDEANYLAYRAATRHGDEILAYSGTMMALAYSANALRSVNPDLYAEVAAEFSDAMWRDLAANSTYWEQFEDTATNEIGEKMNDTYLKANNQTAGTQSYGAMVDLLLAEYRAEQ